MLLIHSRSKLPPGGRASPSVPPSLAGVDRNLPTATRYPSAANPSAMARTRPPFQPLRERAPFSLVSKGREGCSLNPGYTPDIWAQQQSCNGWLRWGRRHVELDLFGLDNLPSGAPGRLQVRQGTRRAALRRHGNLFWDCKLGVTMNTTVPCRKYSYEKKCSPLGSVLHLANYFALA